MISSTSTSYTGRLVDLSLFPEIRSAGVPADMTLEPSGAVVAGVSKAVQGFLICLLSSEGENREDPFFGTNFRSRMILTNVRYPSDVDQIFTLEASKAIDWWNRNSKSRPLDEQIKTVELVSQSLTSTKVSLRLKLYSKSESDIDFLLPVNWSN